MIDLISAGAKLLGGGSAVSGLAESGQLVMLMVMLMMMRRGAGSAPGNVSARHAHSVADRSNDENAQRTTQQIVVSLDPALVREYLQKEEQKCLKS